VRCSENAPSASSPCCSAAADTRSPGLSQPGGALSEAATARAASHLVRVRVRVRVGVRVAVRVS
jgi:hypothetical protein